MVQTMIRAGAKNARRILSLGLTVLMLCGSMICGMAFSAAADGVAVQEYKLAENDGVPPTLEKIHRAMVGRPANAAEAVDTDLDGIPDAWETNGADFNGDGIVDLDLPAMGAKYNIPDIFVEVDWMEGLHDASAASYLHGGTISSTNQEMLDRTADEFAKHGIRLHVDFGPGSIDRVTGETWDSYPGGAGGNEFTLNHGIIYDGEGTDHWEEYTAANLTNLRSPVFRHTMIVTTESIGGWGGWGRRPGMETLITSGRSFMHELGHNLNLGHGGPGDSVNYKPNYLSTMNYGYRGNDFLFSEYQLPDLDENNLSEPVGIDPGSLTTPMELAGVSFVYRGGSRVSVGSVAGVAVDYDGDGDKTDIGLSMDINNDGQKTVLAGKKDWGNLQLNNYWMGSLSGLEMYNIAYNANDGTGAPASQKKLKDQDVQLRTGVPTRSKYTFLGWSATKNGAVEYAPGATYSANAAVTLYAVWKQEQQAGTFPAVSARSAVYSSTLKLSNITLPANYAWKTPGTSLSAGNNQSFAATYTDPSGNYTPATGNITVNVAKAAGTFPAVGARGAAYSSTLKLSDIALPANYAWKAPNTALSAGNNQSFAATYTDPSGNYNPAAGNIVVNVAAAKQHSVTVQTDGNGTAGANAASAAAGTVITLTATPKTGYVFKQWQVVSGGVTIASNKFTMPNGAVTVKAVFEKPAHQHSFGTKRITSLGTWEKTCACGETQRSPFGFFDWILYIVFFGWIWM